MKKLRIVVVVFLFVFLLALSGHACEGINCDEQSDTGTSAYGQTYVNPTWTYGDVKVGGESTATGVDYIKATDPLKTEVVASHPASVTGKVDDLESSAESWQKPILSVVYGKNEEMKAELCGAQKNWSSILDPSEQQNYGAFAGNQTGYSGKFLVTNPSATNLAAEGLANGHSVTAYEPGKISAETVGAANVGANVPGKMSIAGYGEVGATLKSLYSNGQGGATFGFGAGSNCTNPLGYTGKAITDVTNITNVGTNGIKTGVEVKSGSDISRP